MTKSSQFTSSYYIQMFFIPANGLLRLSQLKRPRRYHNTPSRGIDVLFVGTARREWAKGRLGLERKQGTCVTLMLRYIRFECDVWWEERP